MLSAPLMALDLESEFTNIDGGTHRLSDWIGQPILLVNTASLCAFTGQYDALQYLHDTCAEQGLVVLAVPSDDFAQELGDENEVKHFCELNYSLTLPMTEITHVVGSNAHPFYKSLAEEEGFIPTWNFNKVFLNSEGKIVGAFRASTKPTSPDIVVLIEALLNVSEN